MAAPTIPKKAEWTVADVLDRFGPIAFGRIRQDPPPGTATEQDVLDIYSREKRLYELVDGVLVEKAVGYRESYLAMLLGHFVQSFLDQHDLGIIAGEAGMLRLSRGLVRIPDLSFISWDQLPGRKLPAKPIPRLAPDLGVEVLSKRNTKKEMERKVRDYFAAGVKLLWYIDPVERTVKVFTSADQFTLLREGQVLNGGTVLPDFVLPLEKLFAKLGKD
jgi:Uma2 family endonuclease